LLGDIHGSFWTHSSSSYLIYFISFLLFYSSFCEFWWLTDL
jgi:hypothetical protein